MGEGPKPYRPAADGLLLTVRVTPNAGADRIEGTELRADGAAVLRVRVAAVPDRGKANAAVVALLARPHGQPKSAMSVVTGDTARLKTLRLAGDAPRLAAALDALGRPA
jgi:uncharacterized protein YggU (UPF0235/DUF167 family)